MENYVISCRILSWPIKYKIYFIKLLKRLRLIKGVELLDVFVKPVKNGKELVFRCDFKYKLKWHFHY